MADRWTKRPRNPATEARIREYNSTTYKQQKARDRALVATGTAQCWRCHQRIPADAQCGRDWHTGHDDHDRRILRGPEHASCNVKAAAAKGATIVNATRRGRRTPRPLRRNLLA